MTIGFDGYVYIKNIGQLVTNQGVHLKKGRGLESKDLSIYENYCLLLHRGRVAWIGPAKKGLPASYRKSSRMENFKEIDAHQRLVSPCFVDSHTHLVFAGSRLQDYEAKLNGESYQQIRAQGGGILRTVAGTRKATAKDLFDGALKRLNALKAHGVGVVEIKSGYGLNHASEMKILKVIQHLKEELGSSVHLEATYLGAHDFPLDANDPRSRKKYLRDMIQISLPEIRSKKLATFCDVFIEEGYYTSAEANELLSCAKKLGFKLKIHADEFSSSGGASLAAQLKAVSADHLLHSTDQDLKKMAKADVVATLLPGASFFLDLPWARARAMIDLGLCLALATDSNPGSNPSNHFPFIMNLGALRLKMKPHEVWAAATWGGAKALGLENQYGSLRLNESTKISIFDVQDYRELIFDVAPSPKSLHLF